MFKVALTYSYILFKYAGTSAGVGFAIQSSTVSKIVPQLIQFGKVRNVIFHVFFRKKMFLLVLVIDINLSFVIIASLSKNISLFVPFVVGIITEKTSCPMAFCFCTIYIYTFMHLALLFFKVSHHRISLSIYFRLFV